MQQAQKGPGGLYYVQIDGVEYSFQKWGALEALDTLTELSDLFGDALGMALAQADTLGGAAKSLLSPSGSDATATFIGMFASKMRKNKKSFIEVMQSLTSGPKVCCKGQAINFDMHYEDRLDLMFRVAAYALQIQYGNFIGAVQRFLPTLDGEKESTTSSPTLTTSTG